MTRSKRAPRPSAYSIAILLISISGRPHVIAEAGSKHGLDSIRFRRHSTGISERTDGASIYRTEDDVHSLSRTRSSSHRFHNYSLRNERENNVVLDFATENIESSLFLVRGGAVTEDAENSSSPSQPTFSETSIKKQKNLNALHLTTFLIVASTSMVGFSPLPSITRRLTGVESPQAKAVQILSFISAIAATIELFLSPLVGVVIDTIGRKDPMVFMHSLITVANSLVILHPSVGSICISRMINVIISGFLMIIANAVIADTFASAIAGDDKPGDNETSNDIHSKDQMGTVMGRQMAFVSLGFLFGSLVGGRLTDIGERTSYGCSLLFSTMSMTNAAFRMVDSLEFTSLQKSHSHTWDYDLLRQKVLEAPISSVQLLLNHGPHMRTFASLLLLQSAPAMMGDVFQMFAREEWGLLPKDFGVVIALFGVLGIFANISLPILLKLLGLRNFSLLSVISAIIPTLTTIFSSSFRLVVFTWCLGLYGQCQKVGTTASITSLAYDLGIPQGQLAGEKASMTALLKIGCPVLYGMLYVTGKKWGEKSISMEETGFMALQKVMKNVGKKLPFVLNLILGIATFVVSWKNL